MCEFVKIVRSTIIYATFFIPSDCIENSSGKMADIIFASVQIYSLLFSTRLCSQQILLTSGFQLALGNRRMGTATIGQEGSELKYFFHQSFLIRLQVVNDYKKKWYLTIHLITCLINIYGGPNRLRYRSTTETKDMRSLLILNSFQNCLF